MRRHGGSRLEPDERGAGLPSREQRPGVRRERGDLARVELHEIFRNRVREQGGDERFRDIGLLAAQEPLGCRDQRLLGAQFIPAGKLLGEVIGLASRVASIHHRHPKAVTARGSLAPLHQECPLVPPFPSSIATRYARAAL